MCSKEQFDYCPSKIDSCMKGLIKYLKKTGVQTLACCCGHDRYPMTVVVRARAGRVFELFSGQNIPRVRRFYRKDLAGYYYIPEVSEVNNDIPSMFKDLVYDLWMADEIKMTAKAGEELGIPLVSKKVQDLGFGE